MLKIKFAKAQGLLMERRKQAGTLERPNSISRLIRFLRGEWAAFLARRAAAAAASGVQPLAIAASLASGALSVPSSPRVMTARTGSVLGPASGASTARDSKAGKAVARAASARPGLQHSASGVSASSGTTARVERAGGLISAAEFDAALAAVPVGALRRAWLRAQYRVRLVVESQLFGNIFLCAILANTVVLAIEHDGMAPALEEALHKANLAFTLLFCAELAAKVVGLGLWAYVTDLWSLFDAVVVGVSLVELTMAAGSGLAALQSLRSLRVLRVFRVLRVVKVFRYMESLQQIARVLIGSLDSFAAIVALLALFWLVFAIVGLHVFGGLPLAPPAWPNCDTLVNCLVLNFHTLNLENNEITMAAVVRASSYGAAAYFLSWIVLGKFILLALFLAVMLEAFESKYAQSAVDGGSGGGGGGLLGKLRDAGRRVVSVTTTAASLWHESTGNRSSGSLLSAFRRRASDASGSIRLPAPPPHSARPAGEVGQLQPVGEGVEAAVPAPAPDPAIAVRGGAREALEERAGQMLRQRRAQEMALCERRRRAGQLQPESVSALGRAMLGAAPPPCVFPELTADGDGNGVGVSGGGSGGGGGSSIASQARAPPQVAAQPAALWNALNPWRRAAPSQKQPQQQLHPQQPARRQGSGSRRYPPAVQQPQQQPACPEPEPPEHSTYSWREYLQTLRLIAAGGGGGGDGPAKPAAAAEPLLVMGWPLGEGAEAPGAAAGSSAPTDRRVTSDLTSLIAEAEEAAREGPEPCGASAAAAGDKWQCLADTNSPRLSVALPADGAGEPKLSAAVPAPPRQQDVCQSSAAPSDTAALLEEALTALGAQDRAAAAAGGGGGGGGGGGVRFANPSAPAAAADSSRSALGEHFGRGKRVGLLEQARLCCCSEL